MTSLLGSLGFSSSTKNVVGVGVGKSGRAASARALQNQINTVNNLPGDVTRIFVVRVNSSSDMGSVPQRNVASPVSLNFVTLTKRRTERRDTYFQHAKSTSSTSEQYGSWSFVPPLPKILQRAKFIIDRMWQHRSSATSVSGSSVTSYERKRCV